MSFSMTTDQLRDRSKRVTRRVGWLRLLPGTQLLAVEKGMGLKKGEKVRPIRTIQVVSVRREPLGALIAGLAGYGEAEMVLEGFPGLDPAEFVRRFVARGVAVTDLVTRIEFK